MTTEIILWLSYIIGSITFIIGLKQLSHPETARKGNLLAAGGMILAILTTIFLYKSNGEHLHNYGWIFAGIIIGSVVGWMAAKRVKMTAMPQMVSLFNGMGGACAALISISEFHHLSLQQGWTEYPPLSADISSMVNYLTMQLTIIILGLIIGSVSFAGSIIAWGKLNGRIKDVTFKGQHLFNLLMLVIVLFLSIYFPKMVKNRLK